MCFRAGRENEEVEEDEEDEEVAVVMQLAREQEQ